MSSSSKNTLHNSIDIDDLRAIVLRDVELHKYDTALYWADKMMTMSDDIEDVLVCANCLYHTGQYHRAIAIIKSRSESKSSAKCVLFIANSHFACREYEQSIATISEFLNPIDLESQKPATRRKSKLKLDEFLASSLHLLLGKAYEATGNYELASEEFKQALLLDIYCHEAFDKLIGHHLLTLSEEEQLLDKLPYNKCKNEQEAEFIRTLYEVQLKKYSGHKRLDKLEKFPRLKQNADVMVNIAERLYYDCLFREAFKITTQVLSQHPFHLKCLPLHITLLVELKKPHDLFYLAHQLVDTYPHNVVSWFGVACYYHLIQSNDVARQYFNKATSIDPLFGPAWLAFGHSFAAESEHDQAMAAYFRAAHLMKGCHLPFLYIGLEYCLTSTTKLAEKFFLQAQMIAPDDPFVVHEIGVVEYQNGRYYEAEVHMKKSLEMMEALDIKRMVHMWEPLYNNTAHTCRKLKKYEEAIEYHKKALMLCPKCASSYSAIGYNYLLMLNFNMALEYFHKALSIRKNDAFTSEMLKVAMDELINDISVDIKALGDYQPIKVKAKLNLSLLGHESMAEEDLDANETLPNRLQTPAHNLTADPSNMSVDMDMTMDDL